MCVFPVFGMTHDGGSFICMMEGAASYGGIQADISMRYNSYNWMCAKYHVLHSDRYNVSAKTERLVYMFEKEIPNDTVIQRYRFVDSDDYVDMALAYGAYLRETHPELAASSASENMPVSVELVGAIDKTMVRFGMPLDTVVPTTTFAQAEEMIGELAAGGLQNLNVRYTGWANGGIMQEVFTRVNVLRELGGQKGMKQLIEAAKQDGVTLAFDGISCVAYNSGLLEGFIPYRDAARFTTREQVIIHPYSVITYQPEDWREPFYLVQPEYARKAADNLIDALSEVGAAGIGFRDIGSLLSGDYNPKNTTTREQVRQMNLDTLRRSVSEGLSVAVEEGFDYVLPYVDLITDMDFEGMEYFILDESVPFYQIALHGMVDYTGLPVNLSGDWKDELLRCAEYGAGLNFTLMNKDARILQDTFHSSYYGAYYDSWKDEIIDVVTAYQRDMTGLNQTAISGHDILSDGVTVTEYADGTKVYVNYTENDFEADGMTVPARSYQVKGGAAR